MSDLIDRQAFIERERKLYCEDCDRRKGKKNGKLTVCYEIGEAPCRSCWLDDALTDLEDFPAAPRWVRCEDELPPNDGKEVLVTDGVHVGIGICMYKWSKTRKWTLEAVWYKWNLNDYGYPMKKFKADTHIKAWMPLPEPPREGE